MKNAMLVAALLVAPPFVCAQDKPAPSGTPEMPNPKTAAHDALAMFVGQWQLHMKMEAVPGVPGMDKAHESDGSERCDLICNGLWLKSTATGTRADGKPFEGLWLLGYDPWQKTYTGIWACNDDEPSSVSTGTWDPAAKTWTFTGDSPAGKFRSVFRFHDADSTTETCYVIGADGKEMQCMEMTRKRAKGAQAADAVASFAKPASKELALLAEGVGTWDATVKMSMPGQPASEERGTERVMPICEGKWFWSDWKGTMMGMPFEGHALTGYHPGDKKFVSYWIDSGCATHSRTTGVWDEAKKTFAMTGSCVDQAGKPTTIEQTCSHGKDMRAMTMKMQTDAITHTMEIAYKRAKG